MRFVGNTQSVHGNAARQPLADLLCKLDFDVVGSILAQVPTAFDIGVNTPPSSSPGFVEAQRFEQGSAMPPASAGSPAIDVCLGFHGPRTGRLHAAPPFSATTDSRPRRAVDVPQELAIRRCRSRMILCSSRKVIHRRDLPAQSLRQKGETPCMPRPWQFSLESDQSGARCVGDGVPLPGSR